MIRITHFTADYVFWVRELFMQTPEATKVKLAKEERERETKR